MTYGSNDFIRSTAAVVEARQSVFKRRENVLPPFTNRGGNFLSSPAVYPPVLDWLSFTCSIPLENAQKEIKAMLTRFWYPDAEKSESEFVEFALRPVGFLAYEHSAKLIRIDCETQESIECGICAWGGNGGKVYISLNSSGCTWLQHYSDIVEELKKLNARITRIDLALDFFKGEYSVEMCKSLYTDGKFVSRGGKPSFNMVGDWDESLRTYAGRTFYVGKRENGKVLRVYEKGRQLGAKHSNWVRWELELHNKDREIPLDTIVDPFPYFIGSYKALNELFGEHCSKVPSIIPTQQKKGEIALENLVHYGRVSYGKLIKQFQKAGIPDSEIVRLFTEGVKGSPKRLAPVLVNADFADCAYDSYSRTDRFAVETELKNWQLKMTPASQPDVDLSPMVEEDFSWGEGPTMQDFAFVLTSGMLRSGAPAMSETGKAQPVINR